MSESISMLCGHVMISGWNQYTMMVKQAGFILDQYHRKTYLLRSWSAFDIAHALPELEERYSIKDVLRSGGKIKLLQPYIWI